MGSGRELPYLRRRRARLALLVLPALLLRALIPMGFMTLADATGVSIGFCPGAGVMPGLPADAVHAQYFGHAHAPHAGGRAGGGGARNSRALRRSSPEGLKALAAQRPLR